MSRELARVLARLVFHPHSPLPEYWCRPVGVVDDAGVRKPRPLRSNSVVSGPGDPRHSSRPHRRELPNRIHARHASRAGMRPRKSASEPPEGTRDPATVPAAVDLAQWSPFPAPHATRVLARFTEPEVGTFRVTSCRAGQICSNTRCSLLHTLGEPGKQPVFSPSRRTHWHARTGSAAALRDRTGIVAR